jgi:hypothetical protein
MKSYQTYHVTNPRILPTTTGREASSQLPHS